MESHWVTATDHDRTHWQILWADFLALLSDLTVLMVAGNV
jgi:hypothetical protein